MTKTMVELVDELRIEPNHGAGFVLRAGQTARFTQEHGTQVIDLNLFNAADPAEHFWAGRTRVFEGSHLTTGNKLWSIEPNMRVMATVEADTVSGHVTERGAKYHDLWYPRCSPTYHAGMCDDASHRTCHSNIAEVLAEHGIDMEPHDTLNVFMLTGLDQTTGKYFVEETQTSELDYFDIKAVIDCFIVASACPGHANSGNQAVLVRNVTNAAAAV